MKRRKLHVVWLWGLLFLMTACGDDDYYYPSVKLEFVTVEAGEDGRILPYPVHTLAMVAEHQRRLIT